MEESWFLGFEYSNKCNASDLTLISVTVSPAHALKKVVIRFRNNDTCAFKLKFILVRNKFLFLKYVVGYITEYLIKYTL